MDKSARMEFVNKDIKYGMFLRLLYSIVYDIHRANFVSVGFYLHKRMFSQITLVWNKTYSTKNKQ